MGLGDTDEGIIHTGGTTKHLNAASDDGSRILSRTADGELDHILCLSPAEVGTSGLRRYNNADFSR